MKSEMREGSFIIGVQSKFTFQHLSLIKKNILHPSVLKTYCVLSLGSDVFLFLNMRRRLEVLCENLQLWCEDSWIEFNFHTRRTSTAFLLIRCY